MTKDQRDAITALLTTKDAGMLPVRQLGVRYPDGHESWADLGEERLPIEGLGLPSMTHPSTTSTVLLAPNTSVSYTAAMPWDTFILRWTEAHKRLGTNTEAIRVPTRIQRTVLIVVQDAESADEQVRDQQRAAAAAAIENGAF